MRNGRDLLEKLIPAKRKQRTVNLNDFIYLSFLKVSLDKGYPVSRLLEEVMASFLDDVEPKWRGQNASKLEAEIEESKKKLSEPDE